MGKTDKLTEAITEVLRIDDLQREYLRKRGWPYLTEAILEEISHIDLSQKEYDKEKEKP